MEATHMPPVENKFCEAGGRKKAPRTGLLLLEERFDMLN
jgi:hypothetical protein